MATELSDLVPATPRSNTVPKGPVEDAGDVVIVDAQTDPRVRIARALEGDRKPDGAAILGSIPAPAPMPPLPFTPPPPYEPPAPVSSPVLAPVPPAPVPVAAAPVESPPEVVRVAAGASLELHG